jgi:hypothetical protein
MPWEIDYAILTFTQLKKSKYHLPSDVNIEIKSALNLSNFLFDWDKSQLPKDYFIKKYESLAVLLKDYQHDSFIYEGDGLWGHLDLQRDAIDSKTDFYISLCPDMYFSEYLLSYLVESVKYVSNKYFVITPQISKLWDFTWDEITNPKYHDIPYDQWSDVDVFDIRNDSKNSSQEHTLLSLNKSKWAGWFDLYSKSFYEELCPIHTDWSGYGPWDWYSMLLSEYTKEKGVDFQQYLLQGETIFEYSVGPLKNKGFTSYYKDMLVLRDVPNQRQQFEPRMNEYLQKGIQQLKEKNIV